MERWHKMAFELRMSGLVSASSCMAGEEEITMEFVAGADTRPDNITELKQLNTVLRGAIGTLPERHRKVVVLYYTKEMTMKEIGNTLNINESRVSQIHKVALEKLGATLRTSGVSSTQAFV